MEKGRGIWQKRGLPRGGEVPEKGGNGGEKKGTNRVSRWLGATTANNKKATTASYRREGEEGKRRGEKKKS